MLTKDALDYFDNTKKHSEPFQTQHPFTYSEGFLNYVRQVREVGLTIRAKSDGNPTSIRLQFKEFLDGKQELLSGIYRDTSIPKVGVVRPYLDNLYERIGRKVILLTKAKNSVKNAFETSASLLTLGQAAIFKSLSPPAPETPELETKQSISTEPEVSSKGMEFRNRRNKPAIPNPLDILLNRSPSRDADKPTGSPLKRSILKNPLIDGETSPSPKRRGSGSQSPSPLKKSKVKFDPENNQMKVIEPVGKIIFDWELLPPKEDPDDEEIVNKKLEEMKNKLASVVSDPNPATKPKKSDLTSSSLESPEQSISKIISPFIQNISGDPKKFTDPNQPSPNESPKLPSTLRKNPDNSTIARKKTAIIDNRLTYEDWVTFRKQFETFKVPLLEGIHVKKYGQKNIFDGNDRRILFIENFTQFTWTKPSSITYNKVFKVKDIITIKLGKQTENIKRFKKAEESRCFSVVLKDRTIDFEFKALGKKQEKKEEKGKDQKDEKTVAKKVEESDDLRILYYGFKFFMKMAKRFEANPYMYECLSDDIAPEVFDEAWAKINSK